MDQLSNVTQQNAAASEELASTSDLLSLNAQELRNIVSFFKVNSKHQDQIIKDSETTKIKTIDHSSETAKKAEEKTSVKNKGNGKDKNENDQYDSKYHVGTSEFFDESTDYKEF